jgi:uncharacterized protein with beta-barrel porin domain
MSRLAGPLVAGGRLANGMAVTARGTLGWCHAFGDVTPEMTLSFLSGGGPFTIAGRVGSRTGAVPCLSRHAPGCRA